jgi:nucleotide-binding universal stress UspA family protein
MKTIIAPTDFSDASTNAVLFAADLALDVNATLQVYHAVPERVVLIDELDYDVEYAETEEAMQQLESLQEKIKNYTQYRLSIDVHLKYGSIDRVLEESCKQAAPLAVVMPGTEKNAIQRFLSGSETLSVSHKLDVPLLLIPNEAVFNGFKKIAIATDLNEVYDTMPLDSLTQWIAAFKPALEVVYVKEDNKFNRENVSEAIALQTHFEKYNPTLRYIQNNNIAEGIITYLNENRPDLLIVVPKKHAFLHKSLSRQFIIQPAVPTMIISNHH